MQEVIYLKLKVYNPFFVLLVCDIFVGFLLNQTSSLYLVHSVYIKINLILFLNSLVSKTCTGFNLLLVEPLGTRNIACLLKVKNVTYIGH